jgi:WD40 repeat protein
MYKIQAVRTASPMTSISWHPVLPSTVLAASASGFISGWHTETGQNLWTVQEKDNSVNTLDISPNGMFFTSAGSDFAIRHYGLATRQVVAELTSKSYLQGKVSGHESRIFCSTYLSDDTIACSGWDDTVILWDVRSGALTRAIFGTHICGEAIAFRRDRKMMITGSWRDEDQLQFWDIGTGKLIRSHWVGDRKRNQPLKIYSLAISIAHNHNKRLCTLRSTFSNSQQINKNW